MSGGVEEVLNERTSDGILTLTINRPTARNAINLRVAQSLGDALSQAEEDPSVRVVVITGAGDLAFCAGADLKAISRGEQITPTDSTRASWGFAGVVTHPIRKPVIAAVNGVALGGGTEIALACDLVVATNTASFGLPEVKRGIHAAAGGVFRLPTQIPRKVAMEMILTGDPISANRAYELGLVNRIVAEGEVVNAAIELAHRISANAPLSIQASKRIANSVISEDSSWIMSKAEQSKIANSHDAKEGARSFAEKRPPMWEGR